MMIRVQTNILILEQGNSSNKEFEKILTKVKEGITTLLPLLNAAVTNVTECSKSQGSSLL